MDRTRTMKRRRIILATLCLTTFFLMASCRNGSPYRTGDLVFVAGIDANAMDHAIMGSTGAMVHVGIIDVEGDSVFVIDVAPKTGVSRRSFHQFAEAQQYGSEEIPTMTVMRLKNRRGVKSFVAKAKTLYGAAYDFTFLPDNGLYYCSELVHDCYVRDGEPVFKAYPMDFRNADGEYDPFWVNLFASEGMEIPQGVFGTNPDALFHSDLLKHVETRQGTSPQ